jgi:hypothetical protein
MESYIQAVPPVSDCTLAEGLLKLRSQSVLNGGKAYHLTAPDIDNIKLKATEIIYTEFDIVKHRYYLLFTQI